MVTTISNHGKDSLQVPQLPGSKIDTSVTITDLVTMADLPLHGQVAIVVATVTAAMVVLLAVVLHRGSNRRLRHRLLLVNPAMVTVHILATSKGPVMDPLQRQVRQASALSCNNMLVHLRLHPVTGLHLLHPPTTLLRRHHLLITHLHLHQPERSYNSLTDPR